MEPTVQTRWDNLARAPFAPRKGGPLGVVFLIFSGLALVACGEGTLSRETSDDSLSTVPEAPDLAAVDQDTGRIDDNGELLLDELVDGDAVFLAGGVSGEWFTYSDGTGTLTPPDHMGLPAIGGEAHVVGEGFSDWGAGLSAYFRSTDLSPFSRLVLRARGSGELVVEVATPATSPAAEGGTCIGTGCFGHFSTSISLSPESQDFDLAFAELTQPTWAQPAELSLAGVISINLVAKVVAGSASIDLWMDRLALRTRDVP